MIVQVGSVDDDAGVDERNFGAIELGQDRQTLLFHPAAQKGIEQCGVNVSRFDRLSENGLIADGVDAHLIASRI